MVSIRMNAYDPPITITDPLALLDELNTLRSVVASSAEDLFALWQPYIRRSEFVSSALNLAQYLILRRQDLRELQRCLSAWGLSSLGRSEGRVLANLDAVIATMSMICGVDPAVRPPRPNFDVLFEGELLLERQADLVLGRAPKHREVRIMVTLPTEAASDPELLQNLVEQGMDCARINCAHDSADKWTAMIDNIRRAEAKTGRQCRVLMDLAGPKVRTADVTAPEHHARVALGDAILLTRDMPTEIERTQAPFVARCTLPEGIDRTHIGAHVWFDDGLIGTVVESRTPTSLRLRVTTVGPKGRKLRNEKGINFPDTDLQISPLTEKDLGDLNFAALHADLIGYSFAQTGSDIDLLYSELCRRTDTPEKIALVAKIETRRAARNLPEIIVHAAGRQPLAVMIARGDLAVEIGYERLAEMQEEILWLCEAARVPVIWATQVLESLVTNGIPSRAEVTDAAMSARAECVMLNKGPYVMSGVRILDDVLTRMQAHQRKKTAQLRALHF